MKQAILRVGSLSKVLKPIALNEFADLYDHWQDECDVEPADHIDLHVYVKADAI